MLIKELLGETKKTTGFSQTYNTAALAYDQGRRIYRGVSSPPEEFWFQAKLSKGDRKSTTGPNWYTLIIDNVPEWKTFPKRSASVICTTDIEHTQEYGDTFVVFPEGDPIIGICPVGDIWHSFSVNLDFLMESLESLSKLYNVTLSQDNWSQLTQGLTELTNKILEIQQNEKPDTSGVLKSVDYLISKVTPTRDLLSVLRSILNPTSAGFKTAKLSEWTPSSQTTEIWFSAPAFLISRDLLNSLPQGPVAASIQDYLAPKKEKSDLTTQAGQLKAVHREASAIAHIKNPSEQVQLAAVTKAGTAIQYIQNPSEQVQLAAVTNEGSAIQYIQNPSEQVQLAAVKQKGWAIGSIPNPSEAVQLAAVKQTGAAIYYIKNPSEQVQWAAVKQDDTAIQYIPNPSEAVQLAAVTQNGFVLYHIRNPSEAVQLAAVTQNGRAIEYIKNPSEQMQLAAVRQDAYAIFRIPNPSEAVQMAAVKQDGRVIQYIKNPTPRVQQLAQQR